MLGDLCLGGVDGVLALGLFLDLVSGAQVGLGDLGGLGGDFGEIGDGVLARLLGCLFGELDDRVDDRLEAFVAEHDGAEHVVFRKLLGFRFNHQDRSVRTGNNEVKLALRHLVYGRVENELAVDAADAGTADRAHEGHAGQRQCGGSGNHADNVGIVFHVMGEDRDDDLRVALVAFSEQRADRAVDETRGQRLLLGGTAFALEVAAGNAASCEELFLVVDGEGEEVEAGLGLFFGNDGGQHRGLTIGRHDGAVRLAGNLAGF